MAALDQLQTVVLALAAVLACVYGLSLIAKKLKSRPGTAGQTCEILSSTYVGPKERILLLRVHDKEVLIGVGPTQMCRLGEFPCQTAEQSSYGQDDKEQGVADVANVA